MQSKPTSKRAVLKGISLHVINKVIAGAAELRDGPGEPTLPSLYRTYGSSAPQPSSAWTEIPPAPRKSLAERCGWKAEKEATGIFSSLALTNVKRALQAKLRLFSMKLERLWFLPAGVWELAPGSIWCWARALPILWAQNGPEELCSSQQCMRSE